ncbi:alpha/beta hydrolase fold protein, partial [mine drainage metagenome]
MFIGASGAKLKAYGDVGGPCLLIHGAGEAAAVFEPQIAVVPGTWAVDLPGHGGSPGEGHESVEEYAELVREILENYARTHTVLGGHSMGGAIALLAGLRFPELLAGLALFATGARLRVNPDLLKALAGGEFPESFRVAMVGDADDVMLLSRIPEPPDPAVRYRDFLACDSFDVLDRLG